MSARKLNGFGGRSPFLQIHPAKIDALLEQARGGAGFQSLQLEAKLEERSRESAGRVAHPPAGGIPQADVHQTMQECSRSHNDRAAAKDDAELRAYAGHLVSLDENLRDMALLDVQSLLPLAGRLKAELVGLLIALARGPRTLAPLEAFSMRNWTPVASVFSPISPPRASISRTIWPLANPPIAGLQDIWPIVSRFHRQQQRLASHPRCRQGRFDSGMSGPDDDDVVAFWILEHRGPKDTPRAVPDKRRGEASRYIWRR